ncbi:hypothetical protein [Methylacidimicrobium tartarophylax]|uniref:Uncharacterized protein n=1 Tax=Methylacidimicrobium tartarophylax TaxID=1041768 RepID=A0A5E6MGM3_9BACT|nr:hypothetical protein [Methylacidimicrobium tartarophylax]VVM07023.1 hypothetical protein MAMT_01510 [Methylacidimicrobium tartarophylax]
MKPLTMLSLLSVLLFSVAGPLHADSMLAKKKASCACAEKCAKKEACAVHKHKDCDCS